MKKFYRFIFPLSLAGIIFLIILAIFYYNFTFSLNGSSFETIVVNNKFEDKGIDAKIFNKNIENKVKISTNLNTNKIGTYNIYYNLKYLGKSHQLVRKVSVVDNVSPIISLNGDSEVSLYVGDDYIEYGATAIDNYDKDITSKIKIIGNVDTKKEDTYEIIYKVTDSSGNEGTTIRKVIVNKKQIAYEDNSGSINSDYSNNKIVKYINDNNYHVSIGYYNLITNDSFYYQENKIYYGASLIKTLDALYLYDNNIIDEDLKPYVKKAISKSDNDSHYYLINYIGKSNLKDYGFKLGATNTLSGNDNYGNTTVIDQVQYLKKLYDLTKNNYELKSYFINDCGNYLAINNITTMHKYGYYGKYYHDVGIILDDEPYIVIILTEHGEDDFKTIINNISKLIFDYHREIN